MAKIFSTGNDARQKIADGVFKLANLVACTMGPQGRNVIIGPPKVGDSPLGAPTITKDGVSVARACVLEDPFEEMGCQLVKEAAGRTVDLAGDGTTTATVLAAEIIKNGIDKMNEGYSPLDLRDGLAYVSKLILEHLEQNAKSIVSDEDLLNVSIISTNNDRELGGLIAKAYQMVNREGMVTAEAVPGQTSYVKLIEGTEIKSGFIHQAMLDKGQSSSILEKCRILIIDRELSNINECLNLLQDAHQKGDSILIIAKDITKLALESLVVNHQKGLLKNVGIKIPTFAGQYDQWLDDLALNLGTTVFEGSKGIPLSTATYDMLGYASAVEVTRTSTKVTGVQKDMAKVNAKLAQYEKDVKILIGDTERYDIKNRIAFLCAKAAVVMVGYSTELELREKGDRIDDAVSAVDAAIEEGIVLGAGKALFNAAKSVDISTIPERFRGAAEILLSSCVRPCAQILLNAGHLEDLEYLMSSSSYDEEGINCATGLACNLWDAGIIDPKKVTRVAFQNAVSIASLLLTTEAMIVEDPQMPAGWQPVAGWRMQSKTNLNHQY